MRSLLFVSLTLLCVVYASDERGLKNILSNLAQDQAEELCNNINHKSHQLFSPLRCVRGEQDYAAPGKRFKASHDINTAALNPVVLFPGLGGSYLEAEVNKHDSPAWYCVKRADWFHIWFAIEEILVQPCWFDNLQILYDPVSQNYTNREGVNIRPYDFGGTRGVAYLDYYPIGGGGISVTSVYSSIIESLEAIGYESGKNLHGAPYDWRLPATFAQKIGYYAMLQNLIESTYANNSNLPVHIVTHSMGGPTALYFLNSMSQDWLTKYVASFNPIAGPWTGAPNALRAVLSGDNFGLTFLGIHILSPLRVRGVARNAGGVVELVPNTDLQTPNRTFVNDGTRNYSIADFPTLFSNMNLTVTNEVYGDVKNIVENLHAPGVPVNCAYGYGVPTEYFYTYPNGDFDKDPIIADNQDGDGTVPLYSLQECQRWDKQQSQPVTNKEFNLRGHSDILHDDEFIQYLLAIVTNQAKN